MLNVNEILRVFWVIEKTTESVNQKLKWGSRFEREKKRVYLLNQKGSPFDFKLRERVKREKEKTTHK